MPATKMVQKVHSVDFHRNGVGGNGFHAITFVSKDDDGNARDMLGIVFKERGNVAVIALGNPLEKWRGDMFEPELRVIIRESEPHPFALFVGRHGQRYCETCGKGELAPIHLR